MKIFIRTLTTGMFVILLSGCNYITYTPRSKQQTRREKPSILLLSKIVDFRLEQGSWPVSKENFMSKGKKYYEAFEGFAYSYTEFKVIDSNTMIFYFSGHKKDLENYNATQQYDLNNYRGQAKFYKQHDRFIWKLKMY